MLDESGNTKQRIMYDPFGKPRNVYTSSQATSIQDWSGFVGKDGFTSHEHMYELDLIHMNGRVYDPTIGRFLQVDIIVQAPGQVLSYNRYAYVWNNPLGYTDPSGYLVKEVIAAVKNFFSGGSSDGSNDRSTDNNAREKRDETVKKIDELINNNENITDEDKEILLTVKAGLNLIDQFNSLDDVEDLKTAIMNSNDPEFVALVGKTIGIDSDIGMLSANPILMDAKKMSIVANLGQQIALSAGNNFADIGKGVTETYIASRLGVGKLTKIMPAGTARSAAEVYFGAQDIIDKMDLSVEIVNEVNDRYF